MQVRAVQVPHTCFPGPASVAHLCVPRVHIQVLKDLHLEVRQRVPAADRDRMAAPPGPTRATLHASGRLAAGGCNRPGSCQLLAAHQLAHELGALVRQLLTLALGADLQMIRCTGSNSVRREQANPYKATSGVLRAT